jgi:eukaryotic-like serine/threonine-protein kinase
MNTTADKAKSIFLSAVEIASAVDRQLFVAAQCVGDDRLRTNVEDLLRHHADIGAFLDAPASGVFQEAVEQSSSDELDGAVIGPYKLIEQIGEGGHGDGLDGSADRARQAVGGCEAHQAWNGFKSSHCAL